MSQESLKRILLIEDDNAIRDALFDFLRSEGYFVQPATDGVEALGLLRSGERKFDIILSDVQMPGVDGLSLVKTIRETNDETPIILMTAFGTVQMAVNAMKIGAHDFITKPIDIDDLVKTLDKTLEFSKLVYPKHELVEAPSSSTDTRPGLIGESPSMKKIFALIDRIARVDSTILILGESGTGKEVVAQEIHRKSQRRDKKFVAINCAAIPGELLESELFGHAKGSFTGATVQKKGLFEEADGGTLFLDEIGDMAPSLQAKILRVLQERKIRPVGSTESKSLDVRVIAATHKDLRTAIAEGKFREDLYYRLSVIPVFLAPLRERKEDIRPLIIHFAKRASKAINEGYKTFSEEAMQKLQNFSWVGNVRELENVVERCLVLCPRNVIKSEDLAFLDGEVNASGPSSESYQLGSDLSDDSHNAEPHEPTHEGSECQPESFCLKEIERRTVILALQKTAGRKAEAAKLLGIDRKTLHRKELEYDLNG